MDNPTKGTLIVVSGPSGVGKSTLIERFLGQDGDSAFSISYTTRRRRNHEIDGKDYYFVDESTFRAMTGNGLFLEWEEVHGYLYGTPRAEILQILKTGKDIFLDIDVKGALNIKKQCPGAQLIFVEAPSLNILKQRLSLRGEHEIETRMKRVEEEIARKDQFGYTIINNDLNETYETFKSLIAGIRRQKNGKNNC